MAKPFLKWAGGKRQLLPEIKQRFPGNISEFDTYVEPFVGGGAVLFHVLEKFQFKNVHIADINPDLILCYKTLQSSASTAINHLQSLISAYPSEQERRSNFYYKIREDWNRDVGKINQLTAEEKAIRVAKTIFLNRTCFNGLFRVNNSGQFNVPIGGYKSPSFPSEKQLLDVQRSLKDVKIHLSSFESCIEWIDGSTFMYFDPPYRPLSKTAHFVAYSMGEFDDDDQRALAALYGELDVIGVKIMLSNSDPKNASPDDDFFDLLYQNYNIGRIFSKRSINSIGSGRGEVSEIIVTNY